MTECTSIERFIEKFKSRQSDEIFKDECSYWFANILYRRFIYEGSAIMFDVGAEHFGTKIHGRVYDITGDVTELYDWVSWLNLKRKPDKYF